MKTLILASASQARKALLSRLQIPFEIAEAGIDESPLPKESVEELVTRLAKAKALKVSERFPNHYIIGCDQVGLNKNAFLTKPGSEAGAKAQLASMSEKTITFYTGLCLLDSQDERKMVSVERYDVTFKKLTSTMINHYLAKEQPYHCAGSFQIEGLGISLVQSLSGTDYTALIGLPLIKLTTMLNAFNIGPLER